MLAAVILLVFFFTGDLLLKALGVSLAAFRIAGGALLFLLAIDMVFARQSGLRSTTQEEQQEAEHRQDVSVFPLAFPLIAGPGAMTTVILMGAVQHDPVLFLGALLSLAVILALDPCLPAERQPFAGDPGRDGHQRGQPGVRRGARRPGGAIHPRRGQGMVHGLRGTCPGGPVAPYREQV